MTKPRRAHTSHSLSGQHEERDGVSHEHPWLSRVAYVGVDPGNTGAVAFIDAEGAVVRVEDLVAAPILAGGVAAGVMASTIPAGRDIKVMIEDLSSTIFTSGGSGGGGAIFNNAWNMCACAHTFREYDCYSEGATKWKRSMGVTSDKKTSLKAARAAKGAAEYLPLAKHHDRAEAVLIALYLRKMDLAGKLESASTRSARLAKARSTRKKAAATKRKRAKQEIEDRAAKLLAARQTA